MNIREFFKQNFNTKPELIFDCGGRFEILGNHTDHNHGLCLAATAHLCITCGVNKRDDAIVRFNSLGFEPISMILDDLDYNSEDNKSAAMIRGVAKYLTMHGYKVGGFDAASMSTIFAGAGVSSSAAFELLVGQIFNTLYNKDRIPKMTLCKAGQYSENNYFGKKSGLLDQIGVAYGNVSAIDFKNIEKPKVVETKFPFSDLCFVSVNTGGSHASLNDLYSAIPTDMKNAAKKMGHEFLREGSLMELKMTEGLKEIERSRAEHFYHENNRVLRCFKALKNKNKKLFLKLVNDSRKSSTNLLKNMMVEGQYEGSPLQACDRAMEILGDEGACKINGGGFAGSIICVVPNRKKDMFVENMAMFYGKENVCVVHIREYGPRVVK